MKLHFSIIGFAALILTTAWTAPVPSDKEGQVAVTVIAKGPNTPGGPFSFIRTHRQGKGITTSWGVEAEQGLVAFTLQKTYEDPNDEYAVWEDVGTTPCNGSRSYKCTDNNVYPGYVNYRIQGLKADGSSVVSGVTSARIVSH